MLKTSICSMCGKEYIRNPGNIYKVIYDKRTNLCCSYTCYRTAQKLKEQLHEELMSKRSKEKMPV